MVLSMGEDSKAIPRTALGSRAHVLTTASGSFPEQTRDTGTSTNLGHGQPLGSIMQASSLTPGG